MNARRSSVSAAFLAAMLLCAARGLAESETATPAPEGATAQVRVHGRTVFEIKAPLGASSATARATTASAILSEALEERGSLPVTVPSLDGSDDHRVLKVGDHEVLPLGPADVAASGLPADVYAEALRAHVESFSRVERRRRDVQGLVLSICMIVLLGLLSLLAMGWIRRGRDDLRRWLERTADSERGTRVRNLFVLSRQSLEGMAYFLAATTALLAQLAIVLGFVVFAFSQFEATSAWVPPLLQMFFSPFVDLLHRLAGLVPSAVVLVAAFYLVLVGFRLLRFFLDRVATRRFTVSWLPADLANPLRPVLQIALVLAALLMVGPLVGGPSGGTAPKVGLLALGALLLAAVPVAATLLAGAFAILTHRYVLGQWIEVGPHAGEVTEVTFFELRLVPLGAGLIRIPHLLSLIHPVRQLSGPPRVEIDLPLRVSAIPADVLRVLTEGVPERFGPPEVSLVAIDASAATYRVRVPATNAERRAELMLLLVSALRASGIELATARRTDVRLGEAGH